MKRIGNSSPRYVSVIRSNSKFFAGVREENVYIFIITVSWIAIVRGTDSYFQN